MLFVAERVARGRVLKADRGGDIARVARLDILSVVCVHLKDTSDALVVVLRRVIDCGAGLDNAGIHAEEAELTNERVSRNLERQRRERLIVRRVPAKFFLCIRIDSLDCGNIRRSGHVIHNRVEQLLYALVAVRSSAGYGNHRVGDCALAYLRFNFINGEFLATEVFFHQCLVLLGNLFNKLVVVLLRKLHHILRNRLVSHILAKVVIIDLRLHFHEIDDTLEGVLAANRQLNRDGIALEPVLHHLDDPVEVRAHDVHLIDVHHSRDPIVVGLAPNCF